MKKYIWTQHYFLEGKYNKLYRAMQIIKLHNELIELDKLEPIKDLSQASEYLKKFKLGANNGN